MSEFKFNCPRCGQHLSVDDTYAGLQISCPSCQGQVIVPARPGVLRPPGMPPLPGARMQPAPGAPQKTSGLAVASLVCSIGSFLIIPLGFIPGIICGHMAKKQIASTPGLLGSGLAKAGLIVGYISLGVNVLVAFALVGFFLWFVPQMRRFGPPPGASGPVRTTRPASAAPARAETTDTTPDGSGWTLQLAGAQIPATPVTGRIHGAPFKLDNVVLENGWLKFIEGKGFFPDRDMEVVLFESDPAKVSGRTFTMPKEGSGFTPHIWMKWKEADESVPKQRSFTARYALRLEFGELSGDKLPGKIYLCVPDEEKSFIMGTFEAQVKRGQ